jgi:AAT family amino acid transporter
MATEFPLAGSFTTYSARFVDEPFGFVSVLSWADPCHRDATPLILNVPALSTKAIGWNYAFNDAISTAGDLTAAQVLMEYWTDKLTWLPSLFFLFFLVAINLIHVRAYGEVSVPLTFHVLVLMARFSSQLEYWLSLLKIISIVIFFFLGIAVNAGANTAHEYSKLTFFC